MTSAFQVAIQNFNRMYSLPVLPVPEISPERFRNREQLIARLNAFRNILVEEIEEVEDLIAEVRHTDISDVEILTDLADWLGDIQIYCASEMAKFGLDNDTVLGIIMDSNKSKLAADGSVITDERGKVMKGPDYWKPEPLIKKYIVAAQK